MSSKRNTKLASTVLRSPSNSKRPARWRLGGAARAATTDGESRWKYQPDLNETQLS